MHDNVFGYGPFLYYFDKESYYNDQAKMRSITQSPSLKASLVSLDSSEIVLSITNNHKGLPYEIISCSFKDHVGSVLNGPVIVVAEKSIKKGRKSSQIRFGLTNLKKSDLKAEEKLIVHYKLPGSSNILSSYVTIYSKEEVAEMTQDVMRLKSTVDEFNFVHTDVNNKLLTINPGSYTIDKPLVLPAGYEFQLSAGTTINLVGKGMLLSYASLNWKGSKTKPVIITSVSGKEKGQGVAVFNTTKKSTLDYVHFKGLAHPDQQSWSIPGSVSFFESDVSLSNVIMDGNDSEDGLNIVRSDFMMVDCLITNSRSDALDVDFGNGDITNSEFAQIGNDGIDVSGSKINMKNIKMTGIQDKGLSAGEASVITGEEITIEGAEICITSKDGSAVGLSNVLLKDSKLAYTVFQKKSEYAAATMNITKNTHEGIGRVHAIEVNSSLTLAGTTIAGNIDDVDALLYGNEFGVKTKK